MKKILAGVALVGTAVSAQAADLAVKAPYMKAPVAMVYDWTGFYIGANVGVGLGRDLAAHAFPAGGTFNSTYLQPQGVIGGGQIGYNWQSNTTFLGPLLIGIEADIQGSGVSDGRTTLNSAVGTVNYNQKLDWFSTVRGRIGLVRGPAVGYVTGGFAAGNVKTTVTEPGLGLVPFALSETRTGWTLGSGVEAALGGNWTGKIEYLYLDLGNRNDAFGTQALRTEYRESIFRAGVNYRIGGTGMYIAPPPANWAGMYIGANFGGALGRNATTASIGPFNEQFSLSPDGYVGGGQIGYNWQAASWVFGLEADFQGSTQKDDRTAVLNSTVLYNQKLPWFGTARGRIGYTVGTTLFYATGGYAYGNVKTNIVTPISNETFNRTRSGYAVGAGIETPFSLFGLLGPNWTSKSEYLYVDLGSTTDAFAGGLAVNTSKVTEHMLRTGINYHFNQPVVAKY
ncbi:outer membrane beta-barrel protein [Rhodopseudomonas sp. HC1]|uniref:outer membrane protein n=1 Tax=Rhodopseudomonas infernalis TaxID=2897386 RepID=UPI001EE922BD|nr:outer membrane beta-barrel protein [Rhodopseudomonas infernalis]MCG6205309.1 outer membrane beta-barrel protein [Rhodopseudomonas infernalis]